MAKYNNCVILCTHLDKRDWRTFMWNWHEPAGSCLLLHSTSELLDNAKFDVMPTTKWSFSHKGIVDEEALLNFECLQAYFEQLIVLCCGWGCTLNLWIMDHKTRWKTENPSNYATDVLRTLYLAVFERFWNGKIALKEERLLILFTVSKKCKLSFWIQ